MNAHTDCTMRSELNICLLLELQAEHPKKLIFSVVNFHRKLDLMSLTFGVLIGQKCVCCGYAKC